MSEDFNDTNEFDVNNPNYLDDYEPDFDPNEAPLQIRQAPIPDGYHFLWVSLDETSKKGTVYSKEITDKDGKVTGAKVMAALQVRSVHPETGEEDQYLNRYYPSTVAVNPAGGAPLPFLCLLAGKPLTRRMKNKEIVEHVQRMFEEAGGKIKVFAKTRWTADITKLDAQGMPIYEGQYTKKEAIRSEKRIKAMAVQLAQQIVETWGIREGETPDEFAARKEDFILTAPDRAHTMIIDPVDGSEAYVQAEIVELAEPPNND